MRYRPLFAATVVLTLVGRAPAYVEAPMSLGAIVQQSVIICSMVVTKVDKQNNLIIFQKTADIKGKHPQEVIKHNIGRGGLRPGEWQEIMNWAEVGKPAIFCHNGSASETYIGVTWYQAYPNGEWWGMSHGEPFLLRSYAGKIDKFPAAVTQMLAGQEVIVPCMVDGDKEAIHKKTAKIQRLKASLKLQDYNPKRDFAGWGGEDIRRLAGMPGFDRLAALGRCDADAQAATAIDFDADGKPDICLVGPSKLMLLQNGGDAFSEVTLPGFVGGARSAVWADYTSDGLPDLLLATATGPKLYTNLGKGLFRDDSRLLPQGPYYHTTAAAWGDFDANGQPDILLATRFDGLKLLKNARPADAAVKMAPPKFGPWHAIGPFRDTSGKGNLDFAFSPETDAEFDLDKTHKGKRDMPVKWTKKEYADGAVANLAEFGGNCATYLMREIEAPADTIIPGSFGSDEGLVVWLNGEKLLTENTKRACAPDQNIVTLKLKAGKNRLLVKLTQSDGEYASYFAPGTPGMSGNGWFTDVSTAWGLGADGLAGNLKGDSLTVADFDNDGKLDFLYGAGTGVVAKNLGDRFETKADAGIAYKTGKVGPALGDSDGNGSIDLFVPQSDGACKLFRNDGAGKFADVTANSGDLAKPIPGAVGAAWGDFNNDGKPDLLVCVLRGPNRYFQNAGNGTFTEKTSDIGLSQKVFNSQAGSWTDLNGDGRLDLILANEGQDSVALFGSQSDAGKHVPVVVRVGGVVNGTVTVTGADGKRVASAELLGGDGRGGQPGLSPRFALLPGTYTVQVRRSNGQTMQKPVTVTDSPMNVTVE